ncbi:hypothetical protein O3P69_011647 [Scylla paramamosain]|uniref:Uncharacterized protein n=1 Tax=Scylla paramamosain TaxID=85552 RepID=A0AAW0T9C0_SCYPA
MSWVEVDEVAGGRINSGKCAQVGVSGQTTLPVMILYKLPRSSLSVEVDERFPVRQEVVKISQDWIAKMSLQWLSEEKYWKAILME